MTINVIGPREQVSSSKFLKLDGSYWVPPRFTTPEPTLRVYRPSKVKAAVTADSFVKKKAQVYGSWPWPEKMRFQNLRRQLQKSHSFYNLFQTLSLRAQVLKKTKFFCIPCDHTVESHPLSRHRSGDDYLYVSTAPLHNYTTALSDHRGENKGKLEDSQSQQFQSEVYSNWTRKILQLKRRFLKTR